MKRLLNTLYVTAQDRYLSLDGENVVVRSLDEEIGRVPLHNLEGIVTFGYPGASPALMGACAKRGIDLCFLTASGRFLARVCGEVRGNVTLRKEQYRISENQEKSLKIAKNFITGKVYNSRWVLERAARDYPLRLDGEKIKTKSAFLASNIAKILKSSLAEELLGLEGESASVYFSVFDDLILQQKSDFYFAGRNRRPALDLTNAMLSFAYTLLSFAYTLLSGMCGAALESVGLDPYVGFFHRDRPGRMSLAQDLMEEMRSVMADRFVLTLINKRMVGPEGFIKKEDGAVIMDDNTRKQFLTSWQDRKAETIRHPFLEEKIEWGMVPHVQALLLARFLRGDLDEYPPFLWK